MRRREFVGLLGGAITGWPRSSRAEWTGRTWRIGIATVGTVATKAQDLTLYRFERRLGELGYVLGKNITLVYEFSDGSILGVENAIASLLPEVDLLVVVGTIGGIAARKLVTNKPVVFVSVGAPLDIGLVESLSRPGGNMTGTTFEAGTETYAKRLQLLKEIMPKLNHVAILQTKDDVNVKFATASLQEAAPGLGVRLSTFSVSSRDDFEGAFDEIKQSQAEALVVIAGLLTVRNVKLTADLTLAHHLPSCHPFKETVAMGGLVSLGPDLRELWGQAAGQVDKVIRGAEPKDLPVEQPTRYELAVNLKTAKALDLQVPQSLLARIE